MTTFTIDKNVNMVYLYSMSTSTYVREMEMRIRNVDPKLRYRFKVLCAQEDVSMNQKLIQLIEEAVKKGPQLNHSNN